jgi:hypothetical protein
VSRQKVNTNSERGFFKKGDKHPFVEDRYFLSYVKRKGQSHYRETWCSKAYLKNTRCGKVKQKSEREYYKKNKQKILEKNKKYYHKNKNKIINKIAEYKRKRAANDPNFRILNSLRCRLRHALKSTAKKERTLDLLGCSTQFLINYLESQFQKGMTWKNYGEWHIDHIRPCSSFNLSVAKERKKCFHYTNLQPLWAEDNLKKSNKILDKRS